MDWSLRKKRLSSMLRSMKVWESKNKNKEKRNIRLMRNIIASIREKTLILSSTITQLKSKKKRKSVKEENNFSKKLEVCLSFQKKEMMMTLWKNRLQKVLQKVELKIKKKKNKALMAQSKRKNQNMSWTQLPILENLVTNIWGLWEAKINLLWVKVWVYLKSTNRWWVVQSTRTTWPKQKFT